MKDVPFWFFVIWSGVSFIVGQYYNQYYRNRWEHRFKFKCDVCPFEASGNSFDMIQGIKVEHLSIKHGRTHIHG